MAQNVEHTETVRGYRIDIIRMDGDCESPRGDQQNGLIVVSNGTHQARQYSAPDNETLPESFPCAACDGYGYTDNDEDECEACKGDGTVPATFGAIKRWAAAEHGATTVLGLSGPHDWAGRWTVHDHDDNDTDVDGVIFDTAPNRAETGTTEDQMAEALRGELTEYNAWADGYCYGYRIIDINGDEIGACWGFIEPNGPEGYVLDAARDEVPEAESVRLVAVRLTAEAWASITWRLDQTCHYCGDDDTHWNVESNEAIKAAVAAAADD